MPRLARGYFDFRGGINVDSAPDNLADNELSWAENAVLDLRGSVAKRTGFQRMNATHYGAQVEQLLLFPRKKGQLELLAVIGTTLCKINSDWTKTDIKPLASSRIGYAVYNDKLYFVDGAGYYKYDGSTVKDVVLPAPSTAPTLSGSGSDTGLAAGTYKGVVVFVDEDGGESPPSPAGTVTLSQGQQINWSNIPIGPDGTKKRRLYRTTANGTVYRKVADIEDNTTTTYTDKIEDAFLGVAMPENDLAPIKRCKVMLWHPRSNRIFATGDSEDAAALYFSDFDPVEGTRPWCFKKTNKLYPATAEGAAQALVMFGEAVIVLYERGAYAWRGVDPSIDTTWSKVPLPDGTTSPRSVAVTPSSFVYLGRSSLYAVGPSIAGTSVTLGAEQEIAANLSRNKVGSFLRAIVHRQTAAGVFDPDRERYLLAYGDDPTSPRNNKVLVFHWPLAAFTVWTGLQINDWLYREPGELLAATDGYILKLTDSYNDWGNPITFRVTTKHLSLDYPIHVKRLYNLYVAGRQHSAQGVPIKIEVQADYKAKSVEGVATEESFIWGREWGLVWGYTDYVVRRAKIHLKGRRFRVTVEDATLDQPVTLYGLGFDFKPLSKRVEQPSSSGGGS